MSGREDNVSFGAPEGGYRGPAGTSLKTQGPRVPVVLSLTACLVAMVSLLMSWETMTREFPVSIAEGVGSAKVEFRDEVTGLEAGVFGRGVFALAGFGAVAALLCLSGTVCRYTALLQIAVCLGGVGLVAFGLATRAVGIPAGPAVAIGAFLAGALFGLWTLLSPKA